MISLVEVAIWAQIEADLASELDITLLRVGSRPREAVVVYGENPSTEVVTLKRYPIGRYNLSWQTQSTSTKCPEGARIADLAIHKVRALAPRVA